MLKVLRIAALVLLAAVILTLSLIGLLTLLRDAAPSSVRAPGEAVVPPAGSPEFARTVALLTRTPLVPGVRTNVLLDGDGTFPALWRDLGGARESITLHLYYITPGAVLDTLTAILRARARAGVDVRFLYDGVGSDIPDAHLRALRAANVHVAVFRPVKWYALHKAQNRSHARVIVIDGRTAYTGGFGIDDRWHGPQPWRETNVRFTGGAVAQIQAAFVSAWAEATGRLLVGDAFFPPDSIASGDVVRPPLAGVLHSQSSVGGTAAERLFSLTAAAARERLYISNAYFVPSERVLAVLTAAARRGVDVRLLLPGARTDVPLTRLAARSRYDALLRAGVRVYEYRRMIHAKTFVADGTWSTVGTMNLDTRSFVHNDEINLLVWDPALGVQLEQIFQRDLEHAVEIRLSTFEQRGWRQKLIEKMARQLTKVL